jgi:hypothetical protein
MDITETLAPKSDQLNAEDMLTGPRTFAVDKVTRGSDEQPVEIHLVGLPGRPFKPSKTVRRIIVSAWGPEAANYTGRRMTLFRDETVRFGGSAVGGIRVSHLSHIDKPLTLSLTETRGKRKQHRVEPLPDAPPPITDDEAADFARDIAESSTVVELEAVATALKSCDLGKHRKRLQDAWSARKAEMAQEDAK